MAIPTATDDAKAQQAALLQAIVEQGSRGKALYDQQQQQAQTQRQAAVQAALGRAEAQGGPGASGTPQALQSQLSAQAAAPEDQRIADVSQAKTYFDQDQAALGSANDTYMNQVGAAIPLVAKRAEASAQEQIRQQAMQKQLADLELQRSQISLQQSQLGLEGQREANAAARERAAQPQQLTVAEQKYLDSQAEGQRQNDAIRFAHGAGPSGQAALELISQSKDFASAVSALNDGLNTLVMAPAHGLGSTGFTNALANDFGEIDPNAIAQILASYYGVDIPQFSAPAQAPSGPPDNRQQAGKY